MSKTQDLVSGFLQRTKNSVKDFSVREPINAFHSLFSVQDLTKNEEGSIQRMLLDGILPNSSVNLEQDLFEVRRLTQELRAIRKQELILIGERIAEARDIFRKYQEESFREWLSFTFGSFKTGYNYLSLYDLYLLIPDDMKERLRDMPAKAVYILASKKAPLEKKIEIVRYYNNQSADHLIAVIRESLGSFCSNRKRKQLNNESIIASMELNASTILAEHLNASQKQRLIALIAHLKDLVHSS